MSVLYMLCMLLHVVLLPFQHVCIDILPPCRKSISAFGCLAVRVTACNTLLLAFNSCLALHVAITTHMLTSLACCAACAYIYQRALVLHFGPAVHVSVC